ncbi:MAG: hypothetical protein NC253_15290 [Ruminococcus sp.]|nr:hypothetical protein [Ruminococcus sp.]MCM1381598.1 hypothetical protein [Muribaculaceae bacterium]MCM1479799.1 hypothetical protein [Muribaculaceae bacterium]
MRKKIIAFLTVFCMACTSLAVFGAGNTAYAADGNCTGNHGGMTAFDSTQSTLSSGSYYLSDNIEISSQITISGDVTFCLNGHTITYTGTSGSNTRIFNIANGDSLTLCDCQGGGKLTGGNISDIGVGGAICVSGGTFTMYGGTISGNTTSTYGGGVYISNNGIFTMNGGTISGNTARFDGGGVYIMSGTFTINGNVTISGNTVSDKADNVYLRSGKIITIGNDFSTGSKIGVNVKTPPKNCTSPVAITGETNSDISSSFAYDKDGCSIVYKDGKVQLVVPHTIGSEWESDDTNHWHKCENCDEISDSTAHTWDSGVITTQPTAETDGVKTYTCTACQKTKTESVPKTSAVTSVTTPTETETPDSGSSAPETTEPVSDSGTNSAENTTVTAPPTVTTPAVTTYIPPVVTQPAETTVTAAAEEITEDEPYDEDVSAGSGAFADGEIINSDKEFLRVCLVIGLIAFLGAAGVYFRKLQRK